MPLKPEPCPDGCDHSDLEHVAWELGLEDGRKRLREEACPYMDYLLIDAWMYGRSLGLLESKETS